VTWRKFDTTINTREGKGQQIKDVPYMGGRSYYSNQQMMQEEEWGNGCAVHE
jgi:hypothetical protein